MRINCMCGHKLIIRQKEIDNNTVILCLSCGEYSYLELTKVKETDLKEMIKNSGDINIIKR